MTSGNISEPLSIVTLPSSLTVMVTGIVSDSESPSAEAVAVAVPIYVPAIDETGAGSTGDAGVAVVVVELVVLPPPLEVSLLLSLLQPEQNKKMLIRLIMPVFFMVICFMKMFFLCV